MFKLLVRKFSYRQICTRTFIYKDNMQGTIKTKYITSLERNADLPWTVYMNLHESAEILNNCHNIRLKLGK